MPSSRSHSASAENNLIVVAGYPKSGNTLINETLSLAGKLVNTSWHPPQYEWQNAADIDKINSLPFSSNPYLPASQCHIKTHISYSEQSYGLWNNTIGISSVIVITRNPFDTLLSTTNYLRYSAIVNKRLSVNQIATLKRFYPDHSEEDVLRAEYFNLDSLRETGALDNALEVFSSTLTCVPQFFARSGTWLDFYGSFKNTPLPSIKIRFEDIVNKEANWDQVATNLACFLQSDPQILAEAFSLQNQNCLKAKSKKDPFFPVADSYYFFKYFEGRSLRRFCNKHQQAMVEIGYGDLVDMIL
jgi:hypothetical protein